MKIYQIEVMIRNYKNKEILRVEQGDKHTIPDNQKSIKISTFENEEIC